MRLNKVNVNVPRDLRANLKDIKDEGHALRAKGARPSAELLRELWGDIGASRTPHDPMDGRINKNDENVLLQTALTQGPTEMFKKIALQGAEDGGKGTLQRTDDFQFLDGHIRSLAVISGTATVDPAGKKVKGEGARLDVQVEYEATTAETRRFVDAYLDRDSVKLDTEGGKAKRLKLRGNLDARVTPDGIRDIHFSMKLDHMPAIDALKMLKAIGNEEIEIPAALPLVILMKQGANFSFNVEGGNGYNFGIDRANLSALNELDHSDRVPDALLSANTDGKMVQIDGKQYLDLGSVDISLDSKINILWDDKKNLTLEIQDENGKYQRYDAKKLGLPTTNERVLLAHLTGMPLDALDAVG